MLTAHVYAGQEHTQVAMDAHSTCIHSTQGETGQVHTQVAMDAGAVDADERCEIERRPRGVCSPAVRAHLVPAHALHTSAACQCADESPLSGKVWLVRN